MHVHLIAIEVGVIGGRDRQIQTESLEIQNTDAVAHHGHFMQGGLSVEDYIVVVLQMPFNRVPDL